MEDLELSPVGTDGSPLEAIDDSPVNVDETNRGLRFIEEEELAPIDEEATPDPRELELEELRRKVQEYESRPTVVRTESESELEVMREYGLDRIELPTDQRQALSYATTQYLGLPLEKTLYYVARGMKASKEDSLVELKKAWKDDYEEIYAAVQDEFRRLPKEEQSYYNSTRGALMLGASVQLQKTRNERAATPLVPQVQSSTPLRPSAVKSQFAKPQVYTWDWVDAQMQAPGGDAWYAKNQDKIAKLAEQGRIK